MRHADVIYLRHIDEHSSRQSYVGGYPRALGAELIFFHLTQNAVSRLEIYSELFGAFKLFAVDDDISCVKKRIALKSDIDERRLHSRKNVHHLSFIYIADELIDIFAFHPEFFKKAVFHYTDFRAAGMHVYKNSLHFKISFAATNSPPTDAYCSILTISLAQAFTP